MPIYEFACDICREYAEEFFGMDDAKIVNCTQCGQPMRRA